MVISTGSAKKRGRPWGIEEEKRKTSPHRRRGRPGTDASIDADGAGTDAADGLRDGRKGEKPSVGKRLAEERGNVLCVPHPPRQDANEG